MSTTFMQTTQQSSTWSISEFYKKSWALTKRHKKLWIFGLAVALFGSSNDYDSSSSSDSESSSQTEQQSFFQEARIAFAQDDTVEYSLEDIAAKNVAETENQFAPYIQAYKQQPIGLHVLSIVGLITSILLFISIGAILYSWSNAALIGAIRMADTKDIVDMFGISELAKTKIKPMIWLSVMPMLKLVLGLVGALLGIGIIFALTQTPLIWLLSIPAVFIFIWLSIRVLYAQIIGIRYLVYTDDASGKEAYEKGVEVTRNSKTKMFKLGLVNVCSIALLVIVAAVPIGLVFVAIYGSFSPLLETLSPAILVTAGIGAAIIIMPLYYLLTAIYKVFNYATWHYAYDALVESNEGQEYEK